MEMGDINARINAPDVFQLPVHSTLEPLPAALQGLKVRMIDTVVGSGSVASMETPEQTRSGCTESAASTARALGWVPVLDHTQPHELVWRADCNVGAAFTTASNGQLFVLFHPGLHTSRLETNRGTLIDEIPLPPLTMLCPVADQGQCTASLLEYVPAYLASAVGHSTKLADYLAQQRGR